MTDYTSAALSICQTIQDHLESKRDPLTECPDCDGTGVITECCGHFNPGNYFDEPPGCCGDPDHRPCDWCLENNKETFGTESMPKLPAPRHPFEEDIPF